MNTVKRKKRGPKPDKAQDIKVLEYRKKGLSFNDIGKLMGRHKLTIYYRYQRAVRELSTV